MATTTHETGRPCRARRHPRPRQRVRDLDPEHVKVLAGSIKLQGILIPVVVRDNDGDGFELVAGFTASPLRVRSS